ncbi:MAG: hypothetical protein HWN68_17260 [Desulfobacterales bacterium]|nr:hypothetical protein [Desulfobacterales bacterium]
MKKSNFNYWWIPTVICGIIAAVSIIFYAISLNMMLIVVILSGIGATGFCLMRVLNFTGTQYQGITELPPAKGEVNACCIYAKWVDGVAMADKVEYELVEEIKRLGDRRYFDDLKQWLYVIQNNAQGEWEPLILPDMAYTAPERLAIQLNMGRVNELFQLDPSLFDQLKPWIIFAAISIVGFLIFLSGS